MKDNVLEKVSTMGLNRKIGKVFIDEYSINDYRGKYKKSLCVSDRVNERNILANKAQHFLGSLNHIIKGCICFPCSDSFDEDVFLSLALKSEDDESEFVGYIDNSDYLLDGKYIYKRIFKLKSASVSLEDMNKYYSDLFLCGILRPCIENHNEPLCKMTIDGIDKWFFHISNALVHVDVEKLCFPYKIY